MAASYKIVEHIHVHVHVSFIYVYRYTDSIEKMIRTLETTAYLNPKLHICAVKVLSDRFNG
jgi:hypothetical protein